MSPINIEPAAEVIDAMAKQAARCAADLEQIAKRMRESGDISFTGEAASCISNFNGNLRLDLLVIRPLRVMSNV
jgi:hypothetical protein